MFELIASNNLLTTIALTLLHFLWQGTLVAVLLKACLTLISKQHSQLRYSLSSCAMLANLVLPLFTFYYLQQAENQLNSQHQNFIFDDALRQTTSSFDSFSSLDWVNILPFLTVAWLLSVGYLSSKLLIELYFVNQLPKANTIAPDLALQQQFTHYVERLKIRTKPQLLISLSVNVPMAIGWLKPIVLLPFAMVSQLDRAQLEMLILHELAHVKRYDYLVNFIQTCIELLLFFHPAVAWVSKQMRNEREYCSDDIAVNHCGNALAYAHTLTDTAALCHEHWHDKRSIPTMAMAASGGDLKQRVVRIVDHHCNQTNHPSKWLAALTLLLAIAVLSTQHAITLKLLSQQADWLNFLNDDERPVVHSQITTADQSQADYTLAMQLLKQDFEESTTEVTTSAELTPSQAVQELTVNQNNVESSDIALGIKVDLAQMATDSSQQQQLQEQPKRQSDTVAEHMLRASNQTQAVTTVKLAKQQVLRQPQAKSQKIHTEQTLAMHKPQPTPNAVATRPSIVNKRATSTNIVTMVNNQLARLEQEQMPNLRHTVALLKADAVTPKWQGPKLIKALEPKYPNIAKRRGIELEVTVHFTIDEKGRVDNIEFEPNNKNSYFRRAIKLAMDKWSFQPAKLDGKPVESTMTKIFSFNLVS